MIMICKQTYVMHFIYNQAYGDAMLGFWPCFTFDALVHTCPRLAAIIAHLFYLDWLDSDDSMCWLYHLLNFQFLGDHHLLLLPINYLYSSFFPVSFRFSLDFQSSFFNYFLHLASDFWSIWSYGALIAWASWRQLWTIKSTILPLYFPPSNLGLNKGEVVSLLTYLDLHRSS